MYISLLCCKHHSSKRSAIGTKKYIFKYKEIITVKKVVPDTNIGHYIMSIFDKFFNREENKAEDVKSSSISSCQYRGRWYGLMCCLGEESGRNMSALLDNKKSEVLTMLQLSNEFPEDFKFVNKLLALENAKKRAKRVSP